MVKYFLIPVFFVCCCVAAKAQQCSRPVSYFEAPLRVGSRAPEFHLKDTGGNTYCVHKLEGQKTTLLFFLKEDKDSLPAMLTQAMLRKKGVSPQPMRYVFVCIDEAAEGVKALAKRATKKELYLVAEKEVVAGYQKKNLPLLLLLDENATILAMSGGKNAGPVVGVH